MAMSNIQPQSGAPQASSHDSRLKKDLREGCERVGQGIGTSIEALAKCLNPDKNEGFYPDINDSGKKNRAAIPDGSQLGKSVDVTVDEAIVPNNRS